MVTFNYGLRIISLRAVMEIFSDTLKDYYANVYKPYGSKPFEVEQWDEKLGEADSNPGYCWCHGLIEKWQYDRPYFRWIYDENAYFTKNPINFWIIGYSLGELPGDSFSLTEVPDVQDVNRQQWDELCETYPNLRLHPAPSTIVVPSIMEDFDGGC